MSKAAIEGLTKSMALELAAKNITVNAVALGYFNKGLINEVSKEIQDIVISKTPLKRLGNVNEYSSLISYLLSESSSFITGQVLHVNGGIY